MSDFRILYPNGSGVAVVIPAETTTVEQALAAVPQGPYIVVDIATIPTDRTFRNAWEVDFTGAQVKA